jgi:hypothetical protein
MKNWLILAVLALFVLILGLVAYGEAFMAEAVPPSHVV